MENAHILIAHPDAAIAFAWSRDLTSQGHRVLVTSRAGEAFAELCREGPDLLVVGSGLAPEGGLALLDQAKRERPSTPVVVTGPPAVESVLAAFRAGAFDYLEEPVQPARLAEVAGRALGRLQMGERRRRLAEELLQERQRVIELERRLVPDDPFRGIAGASPVLTSLLDTLREIARTDSTVLLTGESGTGKGLLARAIHDASSRRAAPFVEANCVVYSEGVLHSELFGHERGAFTGAARLKKGRFELASGGTLFLDEIGEISPATQLLLLRVLQNRAFERVGGEETVAIDVRLVAATNRDLHDAMRRGAFRSDLFYRLNVIPVHVPPLREHAEDVPLLAQHFLERCASRLARKVEGFEPEALDALSRYPWPGNIRELENLVERLVVLSRSERIGLEDLPPTLRVATATQVPGTLQDLEKRRIQEVLRETRGNKKLAASRLGIHRSTLYAKMRRFGLAAGSAPGPDDPGASEVEEALAAPRHS